MDTRCMGELYEVRKVIDNVLANATGDVRRESLKEWVVRCLRMG